MECKAGCGEREETLKHADAARAALLTQLQDNSRHGTSCYQGARPAARGEHMWEPATLSSTLLNSRGALQLTTVNELVQRSWIGPGLGLG